MYIHIKYSVYVYIYIYMVGLVSIPIMVLSYPHYGWYCNKFLLLLHFHLPHVWCLWTWADLSCCDGDTWAVFKTPAGFCIKDD